MGAVNGRTTGRRQDLAAGREPLRFERVSRRTQRAPGPLSRPVNEPEREKIPLSLGIEKPGKAHVKHHQTPDIGTVETQEFFVLGRPR